MEYLIQFRVNAPEVYYEKAINFELDGINLTLFLHDIDLISPGKKLHVVVSAQSIQEAYNISWNKLGDFNNRLMFLLGQSIVISHLEFIIENQAGCEERNIRFWDIKFRENVELFIGRINAHLEFFRAEIDDCDRTAISHYNEASISESPREQFRALYLALEALVGYEMVEATCDKHQSEKLICPKCKKAKKYSRVSAKRIDNFLMKIYDDDFVAHKLTGSELTQLRGALSHAQSKKPSITLYDLNEKSDSLSFVITKYLGNKYNIPLLFGRPIVKKISAESVDYYQYRTKLIQEKFARDIPPLDELKNRTRGTRWIINRK